VRAALIVIAVVAGCSSPAYDHLQLEQFSTTPPGLLAYANPIQISVGAALDISATPIDTTGKPMDEDTVVLLRSADPSIFDVAPVVDEKREFVIWGLAPGKTDLRISIKSDWVDPIPASVVAQ
jgi:hypothetical protein